MAGAKLQSNSSSVTPATSANVSPITSRSVSSLPSSEQDLIDPPNSSMISSSLSASNNPNPNANLISAQNSVSMVSNSPLPGSCQSKMDEELKNAIHARSQSISQQSTESPQHQGKSLQQIGNSQSNQSTEAQLKYDNDRLKIALAQSSANAKKWEVRRAEKLWGIPRNFLRFLNAATKTLLVFL